MESYKFLLDIAIILIATKLFGLLTRKFYMPQVVGALLAGLLLGPAMLNMLGETEFITQLSELGVIVLMFTAGLETDISQLKKDGKAALIIAAMGVIVPLLGGFLLSEIFGMAGHSFADGSAPVFLQNVFIGIILTATSVSITVETLKELGKLNTRAGNAILGAAVIDDIIGIIGLTVITSSVNKSVNVGMTFFKIFLFFVVVAVVGFLFYKFFKWWTSRVDKQLRRFVIIAFAFCLILSYCAEKYFGVADITGAFFAGLIISNTEKTHYIMRRFEILSYTLLSPIFFASIGLKVELPKMTLPLIIFSICLIVIAVLTKILGCGIGAFLCGFSKNESIQVGVGMISRGEVALVVLAKGVVVGLVSGVIFGPVVVMIVFTTIVTPILLKIVFKSQEKEMKNASA